ncbi:MAG: CcmD family protein [Pseudomonadota bacterium]
MSYLVAAYFVFWLATFFYVFTLEHRQKQVLAQLKRCLEPKS